MNVILEKPHRCDTMGLFIFMLVNLFDYVAPSYMQ